MSNELIISSKDNVNIGVDQFTNALTVYLKDLGLPTDRVLVSVTERSRVINNLPEVIATIESKKRQESLYLSKFIAACGAGLFDAALNFIWDETVVNLRDKVARFDLEYFYDSVITDTTRRLKIKDESDLVKIEEWELIRGCHLTGILSDIGYKHLDYIRDMRNWASAAHPNQNELTGFQLIAWLETCIKEVIAKDPEAPAIEVKRFLHSIRNTVLDNGDAQHIKAGIEHLPQDIIKSLLRTLFGMYTNVKTGVQVKKNIRLIAKTCWNLASDETKYESGFKYATFAANGEVDRKNAANEFLNDVDGLSYLPSDTLALEMLEKTTNLYDAHTGFNNFYNEPAHAKALSSYVSSAGNIPESIRPQYVKTLVMSKVGNGYGISSMAETYYDSLIEKFSDSEIKAFLYLLTDREFSSRVSIKSCCNNFRNLAKYLKSYTTNQISIQILDKIISSTDAQIPKLGGESEYKRLLSAFVN